MAIKPPSGAQPPVPSTSSAKPTSPNKSQSTPASQAQAGVVNPEAIAKAIKGYRKLRRQIKNSFVSGTAGLFSEEVTFPDDLLDPNNPLNDPKYLHLLFATFGLDELERHFLSEEQSEEKENEDSSSS